MDNNDKKDESKLAEPDSGFLSTLIFMIVATLVMIAISYFMN